MVAHMNVVSGEIMNADEEALLMKKMFNRKRRAGISLTNSGNNKLPNFAKGKKKNLKSGNTSILRSSHDTKSPKKLRSRNSP